jgi:hypothetical protein
VPAGAYPSAVALADVNGDGIPDLITANAGNPGAVKVMLGNGDGVAAPSHVTLVGLAANSFEAFHPASYVTWIGLDADNFYLRGVQHVLIKGGDWGPCNTADPSCDGNNKIDLASPPEQPNVDITMDGAVFHDFRIGRPDDHFECMFIADGTGVTIENSVFYGCEFYDIFFQHFADSITDVTIQNNWFDTPWNGAGVQDRNSALGFSPRGVGFSDVLIRYNSFAPLTGIAYNDDEGDNSVYSNFRIVGNLIGAANYCDPAKITFEYNIVGDGFCGPTDKQAPLGYTGGAKAGRGIDFRPRGNSAGIDFVPGNDADQRLATDFFGRSRPRGSAYDAGAVEKGGEPDGN